MNKIRFIHKPMVYCLSAALMIASVGMVGCKDTPKPASSDDGEAVVTTTTTELVVTMPTTTTVTEPTTSTTVTTTTEATTTTVKPKETKKAKATTTTKATKKAKVTTTTTKKKDKGEGNLSVGGTKPEGNTNLKGPNGEPIRKKSDGTYEAYFDGLGWFPCDIDSIGEKGGVKEIPDDGKGIGDPVPGAH